jgi:hypothetical protein
MQPWRRLRKQSALARNNTWPTRARETAVDCDALAMLVGVCAITVRDTVGTDDALTVLAPDAVGADGMLSDVTSLTGVGVTDVSAGTVLTGVAPAALDIAGVGTGNAAGVVVVVVVVVSVAGVVAGVAVGADAAAAVARVAVVVVVVVGVVVSVSVVDIVVVVVVVVVVVAVVAAFVVAVVVVVVGGGDGAGLFVVTGGVG